MKDSEYLVSLLLAVKQMETAMKEMGKTDSIADVLTAKNRCEKSIVAVCYLANEIAERRAA